MAVHRRTWCVLLTLSFIGSVECYAGRGPNIIVIMVDDMGYAGPSWSLYGNPHYQTPGMDRLAREGLCLTEFYASGTVCSPTRSGLLTGRYQQRTGIEAVIHPAATHPEHRKGLQDSETTFAELFRQTEYATGLVGKWHLGYAKEHPAYHPLNHGFDYFRGFLSGNIDYISHWGDHIEHDWWHGRTETIEEGYTTHLINHYALEFIDQNKDRPFCLYVAHGAPHRPFQGPDDPVQRGPGAKERETPRDAAVRNMILAMDQGVTQIRDKLVELSLEENTLVFFLSDNGDDPHTRTGSSRFRGFKGSVYEGGIRVPAIAWWPGRIPPGTHTCQPTITIDIMPTILSAAGIDYPGERPLDGIDLSALLFENRPLSERALYWASMLNDGERSEAMRQGPWKLVVQHPQAAPGTFENESVQLYRLDIDEGERNDLAADHPERAVEMLRRLKMWFADTQKTASPQPGGWLDRQNSHSRTARKTSAQELAGKRTLPPMLRPLVRPETPIRGFTDGFNIESDQTVVLLGAKNALACGQFGFLETLLTTAFPQHQIRLRNMAWQADTVYEQHRSPNFFSRPQPKGSDSDRPPGVAADIVLFWMGQTESLNGPRKLGTFSRVCSDRITEISRYTERIVVVIPVPFRDPLKLGLEVAERNATLADYTQILHEVARKKNVPIVDLFTAFQSEPNDDLYTDSRRHLTSRGHWLAARVFASELGFADKIAHLQYSTADARLEPKSADLLRHMICLKNDLWFQYWHPDNRAFPYRNHQSRSGICDRADPRNLWSPADLKDLMITLEQAEQAVHEQAAVAAVVR